MMMQMECESIMGSWGADDLVAVWIGIIKNKNEKNKSSECGSFLADMVKEEFCNLIDTEEF